MYLSRLLLNPRSRQVQREMADPYNLHKTIMCAFDPKREQAVVLHRLEIHSQTNLPMLLVQSREQPDWSKLPNRDYLLPADPFDPTPNPAVKTFDLHLRPSQMLRFRLTANPTIKKVRRNDKGQRLHSNRVPLVHEDQQLTWLTNKAQQHGFHILNTTITQPQKQTMWQSKPKPTDGTKQPPITLYTVQFNGHLQITDAAKFLTAVQTGIGPARAFGCGLLSLAPA